LAGHDPWQVDASAITQDPALADDPWQVGAPAGTQDHAFKWARWMESMNSNLDIPDAWGRMKGLEAPSDLYVSGMGNLASAEFVHALFGTIQIESMRLPSDPSGNPKGYAFVVLADKSQVDEAIRRLHDKQLANGRALRVHRPWIPTKGGKGRKGMDGKNASSKGKSSGYHGMNFGYKGKRQGVKGRDALFKGKGRSYAGKGFEQESMGSAMLKGGSFFGTHGSVPVDAQLFPPSMQAMPEPSMVAVCGSNVTLQLVACCLVPTGRHQSRIPRLQKQQLARQMPGSELPSAQRPFLKFTSMRQMIRGCTIKSYQTRVMWIQAD